jgi:hypothetical protein
MADAVKRATYEDVLRAPAHMVAEVIDGVLSTHQRPASPHTQAATTLGEELRPPFKRGKGGPGGWVILDEPELHLGAEPDMPTGMPERGQRTRRLRRSARRGLGSEKGSDHGAMTWQKPAPRVMISRSSVQSGMPSRRASHT